MRCKPTCTRTTTARLRQCRNRSTLPPPVNIELGIVACRPTTNPECQTSVCVSKVPTNPDQRSASSRAPIDYGRLVLFQFQWRNKFLLHLLPRLEIGRAHDLNPVTNEHLV